LQTLPVNRQQRLAATRFHDAPPLLKKGSVIDGFIVDEQLHESRESLVYRVHHPQHEGSWVLKTLTTQAALDENRRSALHTEEWLMARMPSRHFVEVLPLTSAQRQYLYLVQRFYTGATLARRLKQQHHYSNAEIIQLGIQLMRALGSLHRLQVIHRDIKPENLHLGSDGVLRILDLGVAWSANAGENAGETPDPNPGTPSYMAPELLVRNTKGKTPVATAQSDLFAAGVTLYYLLSRHYPYGEVEPFQHPRFGDPLPVSRYRHDVPLWLDNILLKACARDVKNRFETAEEFLLALQNGENNILNVQRQSPLLKRDPLSVWRSIALLAIVLNIFLLYLLLAT
jgi:serine/threonine protein kinase